jgi:hypothetical protein
VRVRVRVRSYPHAWAFMDVRIGPTVINTSGRIAPMVVNQTNTRVSPTFINQTVVGMHPPFINGADAMDLRIPSRIN